MILSTLIMSFY